MIILGLDGLEYNYVLEFNCKNLMQESFGKTDISIFSMPKTVVIWSSFLAGKNLEAEILKQDLWSFQLKPEDTFFSRFKKWVAIDVPGFTFSKENHEPERAVLKGFFDKKNTIDDYDKIAIENHRRNKEAFLRALDEDHEIVMGYFAIADTIGHLSFGVKSKMRIIYGELEDLVSKAKKKGATVLVVSDHGMSAVGRFGDHSNYWFWSINRKVELGTPKITTFRQLIENDFRT